MTGKFAATTQVPADRSRGEIERLLVRYGASAFAYGWEGQQAAISFKLHGRTIRILLPLPDESDVIFWTTPSGQERGAPAAHRAYDQAVRQRWRALVLVIKAKLEAIETGITTLEREFLADVVLPSGATLGQWAAPQLEAIARSGRMPPLLPGAKEDA